MPQSDWRNWGSHPLVVIITVAAALLSIHAYIENRTLGSSPPGSASLGTAGEQTKLFEPSPNESRTVPETGKHSGEGVREPTQSLPTGPPADMASTSLQSSETDNEDEPEEKELTSSPIPHGLEPGATRLELGQEAVREEVASRSEPHQESREQNLGPQRIQVIGVGFAGAEFPRERRKYLAKRAAEVDARRNLAEIVETHIRSRTGVVAGELRSDEVSATVNQIVRGARVVGERELSDGGYEVTLEADLDKQ